MPANKSILKGVRASGGRVRGRVLIVESPARPVKAKPGSIIVASFTTPVIAAALVAAAGIITERGGLTAHAAIIAREFNVPCLVGVKDAMKILKNGQLIILDADKGCIYEA